MRSEPAVPVVAEPELTPDAEITMGRSRVAVSLSTIFQIGTALVAFLTGVGVMKMDVTQLRSDLAHVQTTADQTAAKLVIVEGQVARSLDEIRLLRELLYQNGTLKYSPAVSPAMLKQRRFNGNGG